MTIVAVRNWLALFVCSVALAAALHAIAVPASLLIGPMVVAVVAGTMGAEMRLPGAVRVAAYSIIGVMVAASIEPALFGTLAADWAVIVGAIVATVIASASLGWLIAWLNVMPGSTAIWGSTPGAASAMVLMAESFGADARLVAFMQYVRVILVSLGAAFVARLFTDGAPAAAQATAWFPPFDAAGLAATAAVAAAGVLVGTVLRFPSPHFLGPLVVGIAVHAGAGIGFALPEWLLACAYMLAGWAIGLRFNKDVLLHAARSLPQIALSIFALMAFCAAIAWAMAHFLDIDPLTAYLATSPGGLDTVAVVAAASGTVDMGFVMAAQTMRVVIVLLVGPPLARWVANRMKR